MPSNRQILLDNRPEGEAVAGNFKLVTTDTPAPTEGEVLVRHPSLSLDPYMRGRMKLVFISMVTTPMPGCTLRAAVAMMTSRKVITAPPCVTPNELQCSGRGA